MTWTTLRRWDANEEIGDGPALYNPDITEKEEPKKAIRIFLNKPERGEEDLKPVHRKHTYPQKQWTLYTDGAYLEGNTSRARVRAGNFCLEMKQKNMP